MPERTPMQEKVAFIWLGLSSAVLIALILEQALELATGMHDYYMDQADGIGGIIEEIKELQNGEG